MTTNTRSRIALIAALSGGVSALMFMAAGLSGVRLGPGRPLPLGDLQQFLRDLLRGQTVTRTDFDGLLRAPLIILVWVVLPFLLLSLIFSPTIRRQVVSRALAALTLVVGVYLAVLAWRAAFRGSDRLAAPSDLEMPGINPRLPTPPALITDPPEWLILSVSLLLATVVVGVGWFLLTRARRPEDQLALLRQEAETTLARLETGADVRGAVVRCYLEMCRVLATDRGVERSSAMTPREFEWRLAAAGLRDEHIGRLTRLFERVRYGAPEANEREEQEAVACLTAIVRVYGS